MNREYKLKTKSIRSFMPDGIMPHEQEEDKYRVNLGKEAKKPEILLEMQDYKYGSQTPIMCRMFTAGNFSVITGKGKSKKTFLTSLLTSVIISGINAFNFKTTKSDTVIFDTEQGDYDAWSVCNRVNQLANNEKFNMFALREMDYVARVIFITDYIKRHHPKFIVIDGIADLVYSINEEQEALRIQEMLLSVTKNYNCHILCIIHQNKADNFATGFIGSMLMKKAEIVMSIQKDDRTKMSIVRCEYIRGSMDFEDFYLDIQDGIPVVMPYEKPPETKAKF